jgi:hypothetical protein
MPVLYTAHWFQAMSDWLSGIAWGDVATWFTGIVTAGSFWLGFTILRSDRKKEEREQAAKIAILPESFPDTSEDDWRLRIRVWNHSDRPIFHTFLYNYNADPLAGATLFEVKSRLHNADPVILPGESAELEVKDVDDVTYAGLYVVFSDASGLEWKYRVGTQRFSKAKRKAVYIGDGALRHKVLLPKLD